MSQANPCILLMHSPEAPRNFHLTKEEDLHIAKWRTAANLSAAAFTPAYLNTQ